MKKNLILTLALGLFLISCKNSNMQPDAKSGKSVTKSSAQISQAGLACTSYSIFNPHGPMGSTILYSYIDCNGGLETGWLDPMQTINVLAESGSVKCPGGVVTESEGKPKIETETGPAQSQP